MATSPQQACLSPDENAAAEANREADALYADKPERILTAISYRVTDEELSALRERVLDLGPRVREACAEKLASYCGAEAVGELPSPPKEEASMELPEPPALDDPHAVERLHFCRMALSPSRRHIDGR